MSGPYHIIIKTWRVDSMTLTYRIESPKSNFESKYHVFIFYEDKKHTKKFIETNPENINTYFNHKLLMSLKQNEFFMDLV